jgi:hypothetical protein
MIGEQVLKTLIANGRTMIISDYAPESTFTRIYRVMRRGTRPRSDLPADSLLTLPIWYRFRYSHAMKWL